MVAMAGKEEDGGDTQAVTYLGLEMTCISLLTVHWPEPVTWPQHNCKGAWETKGSTGIFHEHYLSLPQLALMFQKFHKHQLMSVCDLGKYNYVSLPGKENKSRRVKQLA